jgi:hypothetical protein
MMVSIHVIYHRILPLAAFVPCCKPTFVEQIKEGYQKTLAQDWPHKRIDVSNIRPVSIMLALNDMLLMVSE